MKRQFLMFSGATVGAFLCFGILVALAGRNPAQTIQILLIGGIQSRHDVAEVVVKAVPILLCALAAAVPGRLGLTNIGGEGQLLCGAIGATWVARSFTANIHSLVLPAMAATAMFLGAIWGMLPGMLKALVRCNEIVITLLLNYVAGLLLLYLVHGPWKDASSLGWPEGAMLPDYARLSGLWGSRVDILVFVSVFAAVVLALLGRSTIAGHSAKIIAANPATAKYLGIKVGAYLIGAFALGGAIAALAGFGELAAIQGRLREGISSGYGYAGFFVAWLCGNRFRWLPIGAVAFAVILTGADVLQINGQLPFATVYLLQGLGFLASLLVIGRAQPSQGPVDQSIR